MKARLSALGIVAGLAGCTTPSIVIQTTPTGVISSGSIAALTRETFFASRQNYKGWPDARLISNGRVWAAIVPSLGRVMQFGFVNDEGVLWENPRLMGQAMTAQPWDVPGSFGGDKTWPAPQSAWNWPPPDVFDREAVSVREVPGGLLLASDLSPRFGIRTERRIEMEPGQPVMRITTTYHKLQGEPVDLSVWVITQAKVPEFVQLPIPKDSRFPEGYSRQSTLPDGLVSREHDQLRFRRDPQESHKIGNDADRVIWYGRNVTLTIESPRLAEATYPDQGCSMEVYTNGGVAEYVELETLGPIRHLVVGDSVSAVNRYRLDRR